MKIWVSDVRTPTYTNVKLNTEEHSDYKYLGDLGTEELKDYLFELNPELDIQKNVKLLNYYGYLHLFIIKK
ncbi:MAG: hypothetical protein DRG78_18130 [Epsilonproteobacteria bacterium]|nr:MAG: hypothetical protein DRG78_18130 [Campylobacterota bacterium]